MGVEPAVPVTEFYTPVRRALLLCALNVLTTESLLPRLSSAKRLAEMYRVGHPLQRVRALVKKAALLRRVQLGLGLASMPSRETETTPTPIVRTREPRPASPRGCYRHGARFLDGRNAIAMERRLRGAPISPRVCPLPYARSVLAPGDNGLTFRIRSTSILKVFFVC